MSRNLTELPKHLLYQIASFLPPWAIVAFASANTSMNRLLMKPEQEDEKKLQQQFWKMKFILYFGSSPHNKLYNDKAFFTEYKNELDKIEQEDKALVRRIFCVVKENDLQILTEIGYNFRSTINALLISKGNSLASLVHRCASQAIRDYFFDGIKTDYYSEHGSVLPLKKDLGGISLLHWMIWLTQSADSILAYLLETNANINDVDQGSRTPLMYAAVLGSTPVIDMLLKQGADIDLRDENGISAIAFAAAGGHFFAVERLLQANPDIHLAAIRRYEFKPMGIVIDNGDTPILLAAARARNLPLVMLLKEKGADMRAINAHGDGLLHIAAIAGKPLSGLLKFKLNIQARNVVGATPLMLAAFFNHPDAVELLAGMGANMFVGLGLTKEERESYLLKHPAINTQMFDESYECKNQVTREYIALKHGDTALSVAGKTRMTKVEHVLLAAMRRAAAEAAAKRAAKTEDQPMLQKGRWPDDFDINKCIEDGSTPLTRAVETKNPSFVRFLLGCGADPNVRGAYFSAYNDSMSNKITYSLRIEAPLTIAIIKGYTEIAGMLIEQRNLDLLQGRDGYFQATYFHTVASYGQLDLAKGLLKKRPDFLNAQNTEGYAALHLAVIAKQVEIVEWLLKQGADPTIATHYESWYPSENTPLHSCVYMDERSTTILKLLLGDPRTNTRQVNSRGHTAFHSLAFCIDLRAETIQAFLQRDPELINLPSSGSSGWSPLMYAIYALDYYDSGKPYFLGCLEDRVACVSALLNAGADYMQFRFQVALEDRNPLYRALVNPRANDPVPEILIDRMIQDGRMFPTEAENSTLLFLACEARLINIVKKLLNYGVNPNIKNDGIPRTPLQNATDSDELFACFVDHAGRLSCEELSRQYPATVLKKLTRSNLKSARFYVYCATSERWSKRKNLIYPSCFRVSWESIIPKHVY